MPIFQETRTAIRQNVGRITGQMLGTYTNTETGVASQLLSKGLRIRNADQGHGLWAYIFTGARAGTARLTYSAAAPGSLADKAILYLAPSMGAPSTNSQFELWNNVDPRDVNEFIDDAIRSVARRMLDPKEDHSIQLGDQLRHWGSFERWPDGASAAPDGWNLGASGTVAREATVVYSGRYSCALTNGASAAEYLESDNVPGFPELAGKQATLKAKVYTTAASRVRIRLADGVNTWNSSYHSGNGGWDGDSDSPLSIEDVTLADNLTQLKVQLRIETGGAITVYWGKVWLSVGNMVYIFDLPASNATETAFAYISEVWVEGDQDGVFNIKVPQEWYSIRGEGTTKQIIFQRDYVEGLYRSGRQVRIVGQRHPRLPAADTDNLEVDPQYVQYYAAVSVMDSLGYNEMERSRRDRWERYVERYLATVSPSVYPDSVIVEAQ